MGGIRSEWPEPADRAGWRRSVRTGRLDHCPPGHAVEALRALYPDGDNVVVRALTVHLSDQVTRRLRYLVDTHRPDAGEDVVARAHEVLMKAVFDLDDPGAAALVEAFWPWRQYRGGLPGHAAHARGLLPKPMPAQLG